MTVSSIAGQSLLEGFFMFWGTLWALVLGFTLSGAVQAFVSKREMQKVMGDHRPRTIVRTGLLGIASSSCSYAATALAKSLFQRGADFFTAMVFMIAATNLVVELGIVLWLLIGWQFALAEFVGGTIMIILFLALAPRIFPASQLAAARERLNAQAAATGAKQQMDEDVAEAEPLRKRLRSRAGWTDAAGYAVSDLSMLRRELIIGYLVAGVLAVAVPPSVYQVIFFSGHGLWTDLVNVIVGPFIAFISYVCSIGNVPLAAALFKGGLSFGGTIAFIFADLITLPLVLIYSKFYGWRLALRLFFSFWAIMSTTGLAVDLLFRAVHIPPPAIPTQIIPTHFEWNYTTHLNIAFIIIGAIVWRTYRSGKRQGPRLRNAGRTGPRPSHTHPRRHQLLFLLRSMPRPLRGRSGQIRRRVSRREESVNEPWAHRPQAAILILLILMAMSEVLNILNTRHCPVVHKARRRGALPALGQRPARRRHGNCSHPRVRCVRRSRDRRRFGSARNQG